MPACGQTKNRPETDARITKLWAEGWSSGMIAFEVGITRNTVIGIIARLHLPKPCGKLEKGAHPSTQQVQVRHRTPKSSANLPTSPSAIREHRVSLTALGFSGPKPQVARREKMPEPTKNELRRQFEEALRNTALLPKPILTTEGY